jgi:hypothetical protein
MGYTTSYGGKPSGVLGVPNDGDWHRVDADTDDPTHSGAEVQEIYLHCDCQWADPNRCGVLRLRYTRESGDHTGYSDICVAPGAEDWLVTRSHHERGQAGQGGRWWIKVGGGLAKVTITTRYSKNQTAY